MGSYRLYYLQAAMLAGSDEIEAESDVQAARLARSRGPHQTVEIWQGERRVRTLLPGRDTSN
jgi:hypothetical protein